ncbi:hypothetical protein [Haloplanus halophilus]|uniref:hypothetical protein n=1 Tax=Haloplanus halophilus TaxID=2949993 RepID=UPI002041A223|nr:hypothetical protein [Haloplanus sp. GDY1]
MATDDAETLAGLETSLAEARRFLDEQLSTIDNVDGKAIQLFQVVTVLVGLLLSVFSLVLDGGETAAADLLNGFTLAGVACLVGAMAAAAVTYATGEYHVGIGSDDIRWILDEGVDDEAFRITLHRNLLAGYADWIDANQRANRRQGAFITATILAIVYGIASLSVGVVAVFLPALWVPFATVLLVVLAGITRELAPLSRPRRA